MRRFIIILTLLAVMAVSAGSALAWDTVHVVQPGETLASIAQYFGTSWWALAQANGIYNPNWIYVGQSIVIPTGGYTPPPSYPQTPSYPQSPYPIRTYYTVRPGDTLAGIAWYFGVNAQALSSTNGLANPNYIYAGQVLAIPKVPTIYTYYVHPGDTLSRIAVSYGTTVNAISSYNGLWNPNLIYPGMPLQVPVY